MQETLLQEKNRNHSKPMNIEAWMHLSCCRSEFFSYLGCVTMELERRSVDIMYCTRHATTGL